MWSLQLPHATTPTCLNTRDEPRERLNALLAKSACSHARCVGRAPGQTLRSQCRSSPPRCSSPTSLTTKFWSTVCTYLVSVHAHTHTRIQTHTYVCVYAYMHIRACIHHEQHLHGCWEREPVCQDTHICTNMHGFNKVTVHTNEKAQLMAWAHVGQYTEDGRLGICLQGDAHCDACRAMRTLIVKSPC
jgi:hypothetical protein